MKRPSSAGAPGGVGLHGLSGQPETVIIRRAAQSHRFATLLGRACPLQQRRCRGAARVERRGVAGKLAQVRFDHGERVLCGGAGPAVQTETELSGAPDDAQSSDIVDGVLPVSAGTARPRSEQPAGLVEADRSRRQAGPPRGLTDTDRL